MFGVILSALGSFFEEVSSSIGKYEVTEKKENLFTMGFLNVFWGAIIFLAVIIIKGSFQFSLLSLPTFAVRAVLEVIQSYVTLRGICTADRSTWGLVRVLTIPLLLMVDLILGYKLQTFQFLGIGVIMLATVLIFMNHGISKKGIGYVLFTAVNAVVTISLFKYDITNYNSIEAEQLLISVILLMFFFISAHVKDGENPFKFLFKRIFFVQSASQGIGGILSSFSFMFAPASVLTAASRSAAIFWAVVFGNKYFAEKHLILKIFCALLIISGLLLLIL